MSEQSRVLMFQGTGSDVGKSTLVAGLCRLARRRGISVAPFKPQNMSNNAAACAGGGEIGRAQALQARAAGLEPHTDFNPVLLKPQSDCTAQVVVHGKVQDTVSAKDYMNNRRQHLLNAVMESFARLSKQYELILVEGAGSAAEVNLRSRDIANMGFAASIRAPVCLIGDIDRGGVIAAVVGTKAVLDQTDASLIQSFIINRFRGDPSLFEDGVKAIEASTAWPCRGVVPWLKAALKLPQEDAVILDQSHNEITLADLPGDPANLLSTSQSRNSNPSRKVRIAVPMLSRIANFDDLDPLQLEPNVELGFVPPGQAIPQSVDAIIIPGTKSTLGDLAFLREQGWDHDIIAFSRSGGRVTGICGGYQLLGKHIHDPQGIDGPPGSVEALGLLDLETYMSGDKHTRKVSGHCCRSQLQLQGYEIHVGKTVGPACSTPMTVLCGEKDGAVSANGQVEGTYLHGIFCNDDFRAWWLDNLLSGSAGKLNYEAIVERELDALADGLEQALDVDALLSDARPARRAASTN